MMVADLMMVEGSTEAAEIFRRFVLPIQRPGLKIETWCTLLIL
jgi:hypothetical protein